MFLRIFAKANDITTSVNVCEELLKPISEYIYNKKYITNERYWKIDTIFRAEIELDLIETISSNILKKFYLSISDNWLELGCPVDNILTSNTMPKCNFKNNKVIMVNIYF